MAKPLLSVRHADPAHRETLLVDWMLGNSCNFACDYCPTSLHDGSSPWISIEKTISFLEAVHEHYVEGLGQRVWLQLTGGEPTLYPKFFDLCETAHGLGFRTSIISNGSRTARFWRRASPSIHSVILTYHDRQVDHRVFLETVDVLRDADVPLHINITAHPERFDAVLARADDIAEHAQGASITLKPLRVGFGDQLYPYSAAQLTAMRRWRARTAPTRATGEFQRGVMVVRSADGAEVRQRANDMLIEGVNRFKGYRCRAGVESLRVNAQGEVRRAVCGVGGLLGVIGQPISFPVIATTCTRDLCSCVADILITKDAPHA